MEAGLETTANHATTVWSPSGPVPVEAGLETTANHATTVWSPSGPVPVEAGLETTKANRVVLVTRPASTGTGPDGEPLMSFVQY